MKLKLLLTGVAFCVLVMLLLTYFGFSAMEKEELHQESKKEEVLTILAPDGGNVQKQVLEEIAKNYSVIKGNKQVEIEFISQENYQKEICMRTDNGRNTDLIICENTMMPFLIDMGILENLTSYVDSDVKSRYWKNLWTNTVGGGEYYGLPFTSDPYVLFYNKDLLEDRGQLVPKTWEELIKVCDKFTTLGDYGFGFAAKQPEERSSFFMQILYSYGGTLREVNGAAGVEALSLVQQLKVRKHISPEVLNWNQLDLAREFTKGHMAIMAGNTSMASVLRTSRLDFTVKVGEMPDGIKKVYLLHGKNIGVTTSADVIEAKNFLDYLRQPDVAGFLAKETDTFPILVEEDYVEKRIGPSAELVGNYTANGISKGAYDSWFNITEAIAGGMYDMLNQSEPNIDEIGDSMQDKTRMAIID